MTIENKLEVDKKALEATCGKTSIGDFKRENEANTAKPTKKENFIKGWWKDAFHREDDPNYGRKYGFGVLRLLALGAIIFWPCYCNESAKMEKAKELPTQVLRLGDLPNDEQFITDILKHYVPDEGIRRYAREKVKILKDGTIEIPYMPEK